ncbi:glycosyltransferase family 39 protein [Asticcacaulis sp. AC402]|uniref:ArnT family glycosyltransferase n=1 Tax=Asticcacaulis sp. AC402 TaxID=1282361 RepID=UPI0003C3EB7F|nr:glycosyltransferase family 39 protein [Asticcacaulis sp. AC402]ESQ74387.1 glycosyl transferase family 39 [Asticcacaulis sp. AC402]
MSAAFRIPDLKAVLALSGRKAGLALSGLKAGLDRLMHTEFFGQASRGLRGPLVAALVAFLVGLPCALIMPPLDRDESRFTQATSQMLETGDYININYQDGPRHKKPVGIHWLQSASVKLTSTVEARKILAYRWPSLLGAALAAFACAWGASRAFGTRIGTKAGLIFAVSFMLSTEAFWAKTDAVLTGLLTLAMAALAIIYMRTRDVAKTDPPPKLRKELWIFWLATAFAILVKGPVAFLIIVLPILTLWGWDRRITWLRHLNIGWGLILCLAICGPWAVAITIATDGAFWTGAVGHDLKTKLDGGSEGHFGWPGYHTLLLSVTLFPACGLLGGAIQTAIQRRTEPAIRFAVAWFLPAFLFFELMPTKLPHYTLPTFAAVCWLAAVSLDLPLKTWAKGVNVAFALLGGVLLTTIAWFGYQAYGTQGSLLLLIAVAASALVVMIFAVWLLLRNQQRTGFGFLLASGVIAHLSFVSLAASLTPIWVSRQMEAALLASKLDPRLGIAPGPVATLGYSEPSFVFEMGTKTQLLNENAAGAVKALQEGRPVFVESRQEAEFQKAAKTQGVFPRTVTQVKGTNYSNGRDVVLTLYDNPVPEAAKSAAQSLRDEPNITE